MPYEKFTHRKPKKKRIKSNHELRRVQRKNRDIQDQLFETEEQ